MFTICIAGTRDLGYQKDEKTGLLVPHKDFWLEAKMDIQDLISIALQHFNYQNDDFHRFIHGACPTGVDAIADWHIRFERMMEPELFPANWNKHGRGAGPIRNAEMAAIADCLILLWDGESPGSKNCKKEFDKLHKPIVERLVESKKMKGGNDGGDDDFSRPRIDD